MAATIQQIVEFLESEDLRFRLEEENDRVITGCRTDNYRDADGDQGILLVVELLEEGEFFRVFAPRCYTYPEGPHREAVLQACLMVSWKSKMVQFEYDASDGEIRATIEFPIEDAELTKRQVLRCLSALVQIIDEQDSMIRTAIEKGIIEDTDEDEEEAAILRAFVELMEKQDGKGDGALPEG